MGLVRSIKTDPFGVMDTRLTNESYADDLLPIAFAPFHLVRAVQEPSGKIQEADAKRGDGDHELRKSACRFVSDPTYPRLELNAAVDRYHLLDGLAGPSNPQNTPASNSERESTTEPAEPSTTNPQTSSDNQIDELEFDYFQDLSDGGVFARQGDGSHLPRSSKLRSFPSNQDQWFQAPADASSDYGTLMDTNPSQKSVVSSSVTRRVRFSPAPSLSPPRAMRRPIPSIERKRDYVSLYRQKKQCEKWKIGGQPIRRKGPPSPKPAASVQCPKTRNPNGRDVHNLSASSLLPREVNKAHVLIEKLSRDKGMEVTASKARDDSVARDSSLTKTNGQNQQCVNMSFSLFKLRKVSTASAGKVPTYAFKFQSIETEIPCLPGHYIPEFPSEFENTIGPVAAEDLVFHACCLVPSMLVKVPLSAFYAATRYSTTTQAGIITVYLANVLLSLLTRAAATLLSLCGVSLSCQWFSRPERGHSG